MQFELKYNILKDGITDMYTRVTVKDSKIVSIDLTPHYEHRKRLKLKPPSKSEQIYKQVEECLPKALYTL